MPLSPTDVIQSFRLRFWREPHEGDPSAWRGDIWHEQQKRGDAAIAVRDPDEAFEAIRNTLQAAAHDHSTIDGEIIGLKNRRKDRQRLPRSLPQQIMAIWRKLQSWRR